MQLLCENQNPCYLSPVAGSNPRLGRHQAAKRKESNFFLFFSSQPVEKSRIGRIKPRISKQFCLDRLGTIRPPSRNRGPRVGSVPSNGVTLVIRHNDLAHAREALACCVASYNQKRPHFSARLPHPGGLRTNLHRNGRSAAQPGPASPIVRCFLGAPAPISAQDSGFKRMNVRGHSRTSLE